jgi:hypothetical protein
LTQAAGAALIVLHHVAAWSLLLGWAPRLCAWFLAAAGFYVMSLDPEYYAHNAQFHLTLLALIGCSNDRVPLLRLLADDGAEARCLAWPERLVRTQLALVFTYTAVDKALSPHWGLSGAALEVLAAQRLVAHGPGLAWLQRANRAMFRVRPGLLSALTIALEAFLGATFLFKPLWWMGSATALVFVLYLEFILRPGVFAWDVLAALLVFAPAGDRSWIAAYDPGCRSCRWNRTMLSAFDWLRRLRWIPQDASRPMPGGDGARPGLHLTSPRGQAYCGFDALRLLPIILPGPTLVVMALTRFGGGFLTSRGYRLWDDMPFFILGGLLAFWVPGVARFVERPVRAAIAAARGSCAGGGLGNGRPDGACGAHARGGKRS